MLTRVGINYLNIAGQTTKTDTIKTCMQDFQSKTGV